MPSLFAHIIFLLKFNELQKNPPNNPEVGNGYHPIDKDGKPQPNYMDKNGLAILYRSLFAKTIDPGDKHFFLNEGPQI